VRYVELSASVPSRDAERAADALRQATGEHAAIDQPFEQRDLESDATLLDDRAAIVRVYLRDAAGATAVDAARVALADAGLSSDVSVRDVAEEDWAESWKEHFHPTRFGERIVIVPTWRAYEAAADDAVIFLDPGMAFGTGQHETTRMCLEALERRISPSDAVLDVGCGSGILSLAAGKLGAGQVVALDVDPDCVRITRENVAQNKLDGVVSAAEGSAGAMWPLDAPPSGRFDIVVANIIAAVIIDLAVALVDVLQPGGALIVSGIIAEREGETVEALRAAGASVEHVRALGEWRCIEAVRA
jgi:ribosomal protein L11 methyltransferase